MHKIRVALAEDHKYFRELITTFIQSDGTVEVVLAASNGKELIDGLKTIQPSIILMDIGMPIMNGIEATKIIRRDYPKMKVIVVTQFDNDSNVIEMNQLGVRSFINKNSVDNIIDIIKMVENDQTYFSLEVIQIMQRYMGRFTKPLPNVYLNSFERELINHICIGQSSTKIGNVLNKSPRTIEEHREKLYKKFGARNKIEFVSLLKELGIT